MTIRRYSSRGQDLKESFLAPRLRGARKYDRIAGYFSSSILEVAGEALADLPEIRVVCNSQLDRLDVATAKAAEAGQRREWCAALDAAGLDGAKQARFHRLGELLRSGRLQVKVLPEATFGLAHGKAGVVTLEGGSRTSFLGSVNETRSGWQLNHEFLWEDDSEEGIAWVQSEFDWLWTHPHAVRLADSVVEDIERIGRRSVIPSVEQWRKVPEPAAAVVVEAPVSREATGLWPHQKAFVKLAFDAHRGPFGARFVLADMVGLGKTIQLAAAAQLMALHGDAPVLVLAPKTLVWQWQTELWTLLGCPSAVWNGAGWTDERGVEHPELGAVGIRRCPRRVGIVSHGIVTASSSAADELRAVRAFECLIVDEAHRARRRNLAEPNSAADPNNLLAFLHEVAPKSKSVLLATATPVQLAPIEAWDLLDVLDRGRGHVLGKGFSHWKAEPARGIEFAMGKRPLTAEAPEQQWSWMKNPLPPAEEDSTFEVLRRTLRVGADAVTTPKTWDDLGEPDQRRVRKLAAEFGTKHSPFIRHIIRRRREWLENTTDPATGEPYLPRVEVELLGDDSPLMLPLFLEEAFKHADEFTRLIGQRLRGAGFLKTLLLRRVGSSMAAGRATARAMLNGWETPERVAELLSEDDDEIESGPVPQKQEGRTLTEGERAELEAFLAQLEHHKGTDPKFETTLRLLRDEGFLEAGCIIFSQYFDTVAWLADQLALVLPQEKIAIYAGGGRSSVRVGQQRQSATRDDIKKAVQAGNIRLVLGTDAASEGLNLQRLGTLINIDLPWNPTRLEQRKGRIQRIGQRLAKVRVYNMRYAGSVEDRVHNLLSDRLKQVHELFGQIPDVLEDVWIEVALGELEAAKERIGGVEPSHPFSERNERIETIDWESCATVLDDTVRREALAAPWGR